MAVDDAVLLRHSVRLPPGRVEWCARSIGKRLRPDERVLLGPLAREAEGEGQRAFKLFLVRRNKKNAAYSPEAREANTLMDHASSAVFNTLEFAARAYGPSSEIGTRALRLRDTLFPRSLKPVTNSSYPEELSYVRVIVELAKGELAADVAAVPGIGQYVELLEERAAHFDAVMERETKPSAPTYGESEAAAVHADARLADLVNAILFTYRGDAPEAVARRAELLEPFVLQQSELRDLYRRRVATVDIDPDTGETLPDAAEPDAGASAPGGAGSAAPV